MKPRFVGYLTVDQDALDGASVEVYYNQATGLPSTAVNLGDVRIFGASGDIQPGVFADCLRHLANRIDDEFSNLIRAEVESGF